MMRTLIKMMLAAARRCSNTRARRRVLTFASAPAPPFALALALSIASSLPMSAHARHEPVIAVAASVAGAAESIVRRFRAQSGIRVRLSFGASGNLTRQIQRGAPFELLISADESYPRAIADVGLGAGPRTTYASGRLALMVTARSAIELPPGDDARESSKAAITRALGDPRLEHLAMANPRHAPYGRAAREALQFLGLWSSLQAKAVMGESVAQSARFARADAVQAALLPLGIILHSPLANERYRIIPAAWYAPLHQQMILIKGASTEARQLFEFMLGDTARAILVEHGFIVPD